MEAIMRTNTTNIELQSKLIELASRQQDMLFKQQEQIDRLEERIAALEERLAIYESDEKPDYSIPEEETIGYHCDIWKIDRACEHIHISNPITDMYGFPIAELNDKTIIRLDVIRGIMCRLDESGRIDFGDILIEAIIELNSLLRIVGR
jgi:hypothetical protein